MVSLSRSAKHNNSNNTKATDHLFGEFKNKFCSNLNTSVAKRLAKGKILSFRPDVVGLLVFGGVGPLTKSSNYFDVHAITFLLEKNRAAWAIVGVFPLSRNCL